VAICIDSILFGVELRVESNEPFNRFDRLTASRLRVNKK